MMEKKNIQIKLLPNKYASTNPLPLLFLSDYVIPGRARYGWSVVMETLGSRKRRSQTGSRQVKHLSLANRLKSQYYHSSHHQHHPQKRFCTQELHRCGRISLHFDDNLWQETAGHISGTFTHFACNNFAWNDELWHLPGQLTLYFQIIDCRSNNPIHKSKIPRIEFLHSALILPTADILHWITQDQGLN